MQLYIDGHLGVDGAAQRLTGTLDGEPVELRAVSLVDRPEALQLLEDVAAFLDECAHPLLPEVYGVVALDDWACLVVAPTEGITVAQLARERCSEEVAATLVSRIAGLMEHIHTLEDGHGCTMGLLMEGLSSRGVRVGQPFTLRWCQPEVIFGVAEAGSASGAARRSGGPEDDVHDLGALFLELLVGIRDAQLLLGEVGRLNDPPRHHRRLREGMRTLGVRDELARIIERMCSFHPDERPTPAEVVELTSGLQVVDHALHHAVDQRAVALPTPSDDHPLVGLELGERAAPPADRTMGPADWASSPPELPSVPTPPRPELPPLPKPRFDTGGVTVFERQRPKRVVREERPAEEAASSPAPAPFPSTSTPAPAPYVPPPQLDTPAEGSRRGAGWLGWLIGGGCLSVGVLSVGGIVAIALGILLASLL